MMILLKILKWLGIILLVLLLIVLVLLLIVLFVPIRYKLHAAVKDPDSHEEFPVNVFKENSDVLAEVSWLFGAVKAIVTYPSKELLCVRLFGKDIGIMDKLGKKDTGEQEQKKEEPEEEKKEETSLPEKAEEIIGKAEKYLNAGDYLYRVLTGRCGRRAFRKIKERLAAIILHILPGFWALDGTVGLSDPCLNGQAAQIIAVLRPFMNDHLRMKTQWELYRCDLRADASGRLRLFVPVKEALPLVFDKDCRKVLQKLKKVKAKLQ